ncbi:MAG: hypothetical protein ABIG85_04745 [Chloroflexota bacterium]
MEPTSEEPKTNAAEVAAKAAIKAQLKSLKAERDKALEAKDGKGLKKVRRKMHGLKRRLRTAAS